MVDIVQGVALLILGLSHLLHVHLHRTALRRHHQFDGSPSDG